MKTKHFHNAAVNYLHLIVVLALAIPVIAEDIQDNNAVIANSEALFSSATTRGIRYRLVEGSWLTDDCLPCLRPVLPPVPIRGTFWLKPTGRDMWFSYFAIRDLRFISATSQPGYIGRLEGKYQIGGDFAFVHRMTLLGRINQFEGLEFDSGVAFPQMWFPWIEIDLQQVPPTDPLHTFTLHLVAVPWPAIWFSTEHGFHASRPLSNQDSYISDGDLLSAAGKVVRRNHQLTGRLGIMPIVPDLGLDAVLKPPPNLRDCSMSLRSPIWFSTEDGAFSETLGEMLGNGDLLSDAGRVVRHNADLIKRFSPQPPVHDYGLDAVTFGPNGMLLFSTEEDFFSESLGVTIDNGDLLCEDGRIFKTNAELMTNFKPIEPKPIRFGLDATYIWPHGEVWFSIEADFVDSRLGRVGNGDLLSDRGRIVARNLELLSRFGPLEDLADFGLDALEVLLPGFAPDFDGDGEVGLADFAVFAACWQQPDCDICDGLDLNGDGKVGPDDLSEFAADWLAGIQ
jgi:hypothetical protein